MTSFVLFLLCILCIVLAFKIAVWMWKAVFVILLIILFLLTLCNGLEVYAYEYTPNEIVSIGKVVHHEAGNQSDLGKRLVADTILNRVESDYFPNTVEEVINQKGQYCDPKDYPPNEIYKLVAEEIYTRTNYQVLWFKRYKYHKYGDPIIKEGDHYFSGGLK